jgi:hypothetical protein
LIRRLEIKRSYVRILSLGALSSRFFPALQHLSVTGSGVLNLTDPLPDGMQTLNLSHNALQTIDLRTFESKTSALYDLDLSYNRLVSLPDNTFRLPLARLDLIGNIPTTCLYLCSNIMVPPNSDQLTL